MIKAGFSDIVGADWIDLKRKVCLSRILIFTDPQCRKWIVPKGTIVNGASIPRFLWHIIGGPFSGRYRRASVVHDHYCKTKERSSKETHFMFYQAMRCDKVNIIKAKAMYFAIRLFGPDWK